ncbi:MAG: YvcK family protein [Candidatus Omnitrophica bacterium]|nr:YvcK family protein [Candidatus Omnitrophota bacterium]MDD5081382.1 YvcK family protein [Candidatus Omnitrophota bacterium]MDD5441176.1 YvcK family protein [Candidatus Omnitrophota bacterium]
MKLLKKIKWFYPGIRVKRWISLGVVGIALTIIGTVRFTANTDDYLRWLDFLIILSGVYLIISGVRSVVRSFISIFLPYENSELVDIVYKQRYLQRGPKIVAIGGGHGLSSLLMGLKEYTTNLIAIVTVADSGGSTGRLRDEFDVQAPGDLRNCIVALADASPLMGDLFQYRFKKDSELKGHNFGNLFITAMTQLTGDFKKAIEESSRILAIRGKVFPSTINNVNLVAKYKDGSYVEGEAMIPEKGMPIDRVYLKVKPSEKNKKIQATPETIEAIKKAELIVIGPGSLYTSILPNLVIDEISEAIAKSKALKIYVCNVMTQHGETDNYSTSDHVKTLIKHTNPKIIDYCIINDTKPWQRELLEKYSKEKAYPTKVDTDEVRRMGYKVLEKNIISESNFLRHDHKKLARAIMNLYRREAARKEF